MSGSRRRLPFATIGLAGLRCFLASSVGNGKRSDSNYEPGLLCGAWIRVRVNQWQEFVVAGHTLGRKTIDALIFGHYEARR